MDSYVNALLLLCITPARTHTISGLKSGVLKLTFLTLKTLVKSGLEFFILKFTKSLQSCCCPVPKNLTIRAELAWQVSRYLCRGSVNFKIKNSRPLFTIIFKSKMVISNIIERVLAGVVYMFICAKMLHFALFSV
jgi:hypothetical protein